MHSDDLPEPSRRVRAVAIASSALAFVLLLATSRDYALTWDEGHTVRREVILSRWFARLTRGGPEGRASAFTRPELERSWPFARAEPDGHPPFYALLGLAGRAVSKGFLAPKTSFRLGPIALAAITAGIVYAFVARRRGVAAGLVASWGMLLVPQVFSLAHYAHYDEPMASLWVLAQIAFLASLRSGPWAIAFGVLWGMSLGCKFTGIFAVIPPLLWVALFEWLPRLRLTPATKAEVPRLRGTRALLVGGLCAALTLYAMLPPWWTHPIEGFLGFLRSNLTRSETKPIPTMYAGEFHAFALPWHNTLVLSVISLPVAMLALGAIGAASGLARRRTDREVALWSLSWLTLMVVRALPNAPGHDGVRLFLPSVLSLAILAGYGVGYLDEWARRIRLRGAGLVLAALLLAEESLAIGQLYPYTLSYYNVAFGGLKAAERKGFELTYYWDTLGPEFLGWVRDESKRRPLALRFPIDLMNVRYLRQWGDLPEDVPIAWIEAPPEPDYVLQRRRGVYYAYDWWLEARGKPEFTIRRQGVDLLRVYPFSESFRAFQETVDEPVPPYLRN